MNGETPASVVSNGTRRDTQEDAPLAAAINRFDAESVAMFTTPGHKRAQWLADPLLDLDLPVAAGADDTQLSGDYLGRAERLAAELWSADFCRLSVNGSTHGNQTFALAVGVPGDRVAVPRNLHKSLFAGLILAGLEPVWMQPRWTRTRAWPTWTVCRSSTRRSWRGCRRAAISIRSS